MRRTMGMVSNVLPLRLGIDPKDRLDDLLKHVSERVRHMSEHQRYRAEDLRHDLGLRPEELGVYGTVVNVMPFGYDLRFAGHPSRAYNLSLGPVDELSIVAYDRQDGSGLRIDFDANPTNYTTEALAGHHRRFLALLARLAVRAPTYRFSGWRSSRGERQMLLQGFNATSRPLPEATLPELFEAQVERDPQATALVFGEESLSYQRAQRAGQPAGPSFDRAGRGARKPGGHCAGALPRDGGGLAGHSQGRRGLPALGSALS